MLGVLSEAENHTISAGLNDVVMDYLEDAVDRNGTTELVFRSGSTKTIQSGSWVVNCTGYVGITEDRPYEPYVSPSGAVVSVNMRSATLHLPSYAGYFLGHLLFLGKLSGIPLYEVDWQQLRTNRRSHSHTFSSRSSSTTSALSTTTCLVAYSTTTALISTSGTRCRAACRV